VGLGFAAFTTALDLANMQNMVGDHGHMIFVNVSHAAVFDWSDVGIHVALGALCVFAALQFPRAATIANALLVLAAGLSVAMRSEPPEFACVRAGDDWRKVRLALGPVTYEAASLAQARALGIGYSAPSPLYFREAGAAAIFVRGEYAVWVVHDDRTVKGLSLAETSRMNTLLSGAAM
jgi:hypothetical protein